MRALTFRTTITLAVLAIVTTLALCLIGIQTAVLHVSVQAFASAYMDVASASTLTKLEGEVSELRTLVRVLATSPFLADSNQRSGTGGATGLFKTALRQLPNADNLYVGYDNGCWLQVRRLSDLDDAERERLGAPPGGVFAVSLVLPTDTGALPLRRIFQDDDGNTIAQSNIPSYGYDVRQRDWYRETMKSNHLVVSPPYLSYSLGTPVITLSTPLRGKVSGTIAVDLKLDTFSDFVYGQRPGEHGAAIVFNKTGTLIADPQYRQLIDDLSHHPNQPNLANIYPTAFRDSQNP